MRSPVVGIGLCAVLALAGCAQGRVSDPVPAADGILPTGLGPEVDEGITRARRATAAFRDLAHAAQAGYPPYVAQCVDHPPDGAMGHHHQNADLLDALLEIERPEILVYGTTAAGDYRLNGVEYVVPFSAWSEDEPPTLLGQSLKRAPALGIWYLHVWIWEPNPSGLFADWNPAVRC